jgi:hypothetical protein
MTEVMSEEKVEKLLKSKPRYGGECHCEFDTRDIIQTIHHGNFDEIIEYDRNCGGAIV